MTGEQFMQMVAASTGSVAPVEDPEETDFGDLEIMPFPSAEESSATSTDTVTEPPQEEVATESSTSEPGSEEPLAEESASEETASEPPAEPAPEA